MLAAFLFCLQQSMHVCVYTHTHTYIYLCLSLVKSVVLVNQNSFVTDSFDIFYIDFAIFHLVLPSNLFVLILKQLKVDTTQHFILIDGTWSNSAAMFRRLQVTSGWICSAFSSV